jgi:hypothetical protein
LSKKEKVKIIRGIEVNTMKLKRNVFCSVFLMTFLMLLINAPEAAFQTRTTKIIKKKQVPKNKQLPGEPIPSYSSETYNEVVNKLMPRAAATVGETEFILTVRILPPFQSESQYDFIKRKNGEVEVIHRKATENIQYKMYDILDESPEVDDADDEATEFASRLKVEKRQTSLKRAKFDNLVEELKQALAKNEKILDDGALDSITIEFWLSGDKPRKVSLGITQLEILPKSDENPVITWIREMRKEVGL